MTNVLVSLYALVLISLGIISTQTTTESLPTTDVSEPAPKVAMPATAQLPVPYVSQMPYGTLVKPWSVACEEASSIMADSYYRGIKTVTRDESVTAMQPLFHWENQIFGDNSDTNAEQTAEFVNAKLGFIATVKRDPTLDDIKRELSEGRPVMALVNRFELYQDATRRIPHTSYHMIVVIGYDDTTETFTVHDPARIKGREYGYARLMDALHDFDLVEREAIGGPVVLLTAPKEE